MCARCGDYVRVRQRGRPAGVHRVTQRPRDREQYLDSYSEDLILHGADADGIKQLATFYRAVWDAIPDLTVTIEAVMAEGDEVAARYSGRGPTPRPARRSPWRADSPGTASRRRSLSSGGSPPGPAGLSRTSSSPDPGHRSRASPSQKPGRGRSPSRDTAGECARLCRASPRTDGHPLSPSPVSGPGSGPGSPASSRVRRVSRSAVTASSCPTVRVSVAPEGSSPCRSRGRSLDPPESRPGGPELLPSRVPSAGLSLSPTRRASHDRRRSSGPIVSSS